MHDSRSILARPLGETTNTSKRIPTNAQQSQSTIPSIRLITAIPSKSGLSSEANASFNNTSFEGSSWGSIPSSVLAPKPESTPKRRLVPKKSKLGLLNVINHKDKRPIDSSGTGHHEARDQSFDIYVDPTVDPDIGEILMVKKKKSRAALDGMSWGPLGEVTNIPASSSEVKNEKSRETTQPLQPSAVLKVKGEENNKWWSIGRGRKDSKDKSVKEGKENKQQTRAKSPEPPVISIRSKTPEPLKLAGDSRIRFNSLDTGALLKSPTTLPLSVGHASDPEPDITSRTGLPTTDALLSPPPATSTSAHQNQRSIALRAMRSVRSLARIGSWAQLKKDSGSQQEKEEKANEKEAKPQESSKSETGRKKEKKSKREKGKGKGKEKEKKEKAVKEKEEAKMTPTSTFEVDSLSSSAMRSPKGVTPTLGRKVSILGLGLPSSIRLPTLRGGSTASSVVTAAQSNSNRLSVESGILGRGRSGSVLSNGSSLRPVSTASSNSRVSSNSSSSVRWDEEGLETVKEQRRKERLEKAKEEKRNKKQSDKDKTRDKDVARKRHISDIFPDPESSASPLSDEATPRPPSKSQGPLLTVEEATCDHSGEDEDDPTPTKIARPRPVSDQLLGKSRPVAMYDNGEGVLSVLDAATDDLAQLIMTLNLEATPGGTPNMAPLSPLFDDSGVDGDAKPRLPKNPLQRTLRRGITSIASLRPYAQSLRRTGSQLLGGSKNSLRQTTSPMTGEAVIGQQIAPWSQLLEGMSSNKRQANGSSLTQKVKHSVSPPGTFRRGHRRQPTPAPEPEPAPEFHPLRPAARPKNAASYTPAGTDDPLLSESSESSIELGRGGMLMRNAPCSNTFGSRRRGSLNPRENKKSLKIPIPPETKRVLGMSGTMGGSDVPAIYSVPEMDASDPDSDIPDELQFILSVNAGGVSSKPVPQDDDTLSFSSINKRASGPPPTIPLPYPVNIPTEMTFLAMKLPATFGTPIIEDDENMDEEEDTIQSFDFTGELRRLKETGGSDRRSFVEQLENAFSTPPKLELNFTFDGERLSVPDERPLSRLPFALTKERGKGEKKNGATTQLSAFGKHNEMELTMTEGEPESDSGSQFMFDSCNSEMDILDAKEPTLPSGRDSMRSGTDDDEPLMPDSPGSFRPPNGELNTSFKFGGLPKPSPVGVEKKLSLSDIIPPPSHARRLANPPSLSEEEASTASVLKSLYAKPENAPLPRSRLNSNSSAKRRNRISARSFLGHSRQSSAASFTGFDSFEEIRRGFEFGGPRPIFYPPASTVVRTDNQQRESVLSIPSISSYGRVINPGIVDPFGFSLPCLQERPVSEDISSATFSFSVDDTFSFMHRQSRRIRVDSDASSFYFRPPLPNISQDRSYRRESGISVISRPVSVYSKDFTVDSRTDTSASSSSAAPYLTHGAIGGRAAWARHRHDPSIDSVINDLSGLKLGRPGLGDKMFNTTFHQDMPPSYASSSPSDYDQSSQVLSPEYSRNSICDSIMDVDEARDSIIDKKDQQKSDLTASVFGDTRAHGFLPPFRPLSVLSTLSVQSPPKEDDTWISMIGGGQIRRNSVASVLQASPCARAEKRKKKVFHPMDYHEELSSPKKARIMKEPSIVTTSLAKFGGGEQIIKGTQDILGKQSLEDSVLVGRGEDTSVPLGSIPVFSRPLPAGRSRSSTCTSSSGADTPPLSADGSSTSGGSQSSIDLAQLNSLLAQSSNLPMSNTSAARTRTRLRARGQGHRRRYSAARISRHSVYETIEEETNVSPTHTMMSSKSATPTNQPVIVVTSDSADLTVSDGSFWDSERGLIALDQYYALRNEADHTVVESKRIWMDTPFSLFAVQNFRPPRNPEGMKALLQHSVQNFGPLPSELRPRRRSRTFSRPSPYPLARVGRVFYAPEPKSDSPPTDHRVGNGLLSQAPAVLQDVHINSNVPPSPAPSFTFRALSPEKEFLKSSPLERLAVRPRVGSTARRVVKRNAKSFNVDQKENKENKENVSTGSVKCPGDSLRLNRPRPRGRPANTAQSAQPRPIRI